MTPGAELQHARSERKLSLADVTRATKIQPWVLEALEADRLQELMSPIYVRGFLTTYAKFLHLDPIPLLAQLRWPEPEGSPQPLTETTVHLPAVWSWTPTIARRIGMAAAVGAAMMGLIAIKPLRRLPPPASGPQKLASVSAVSETLVKPPSLPTLAILATQPLELSVTAHRTTWIQVRADGKLLTQQRLPRGARERWTAKKQFELVVSQPAHVELTLNGQPISPFAIAHRGRLFITHHGVTKLPGDAR